MPASSVKLGDVSISEIDPIQEFVFLGIQGNETVRFLAEPKEIKFTCSPITVSLDEKGKGYVASDENIFDLWIFDPDNLGQWGGEDDHLADDG